MKNIKPGDIVLAIKNLPFISGNTVLKPETDIGFSYRVLSINDNHSLILVGIESPQFRDNFMLIQRKHIRLVAANGILIGKHEDPSPPRTPSEAV